MADLGALTLKFPTLGAPITAIPGFMDYGATGTKPLDGSARRATAPWIEPTLFPDPREVDADCYLSGTVTASGTPVPYARVRVFYRPTGELVATVRCDGSGAFQLYGFPKEAASYFAVATAPDGGTSYNASIYDKLTPLPDVRARTAYPESSGFAKYGDELTVKLAVEYIPIKVTNVSVLLHFDGANNGTSIVDDTMRAWTRVGNVVTSTAQKKFGTASAYFDGTGDALTTESTASFNILTGDFQMEGWCYQPSSTEQAGTRMLGMSNTAGGINVALVDGKLSLGYEGGTWENAATTAIPTGQWVHWVVSRQSDTVRGYIDGTEVFSGTNTRSFPQAVFSVGGRSDGTDSFFGYMDEFLLMVGAVRTTTAYTPPKVPYLMVATQHHFDTGFTDDLGRAWTTTGSGIFTISSAQKVYGAASMLVAASFSNSVYMRTTVNMIGTTTTPFTIEAFVYCTSFGGIGSPIFAAPVSVDPGGIQMFYISVNGQVAFMRQGNVGGNVYSLASATGIVPLNEWVHVAMSYDRSSKMRLFLNGIKVAEGTTAVGWYPTGGSYIASTINTVRGGASGTFRGHIDELRVAVGSTLYATNFAPPREAFYVE